MAMCRCMKKRTYIVVRGEKGLKEVRSENEVKAEKSNGVVSWWCNPWTSCRVNEPDHFR